MGVKRILKGMARPFARPFLTRVDGMIRVQVDEVREDLAAVEQYTPVILSTIASQHARERWQTRTLDEHARFLQELSRRMEFVRREILFETQYGQGSRERLATREPKILNTDALDAAQGEIRLNLGAGHIPRAGYLNVDSRDIDGIDIAADVHELPFEPDQVAEIYSAHMLEHFPIEELRRTLLPYWVSLLRPGGQFVAVVPDMETMIAECAAGRVPFEEFREVTYGAQEYEGDSHFNGFSQESLRELLEEAGLVEVSVREFGRRNGMCFEMEVEGMRPSTTSA